MRINLTDENMQQIHDGADLIVDGEKWVLCDAGERYTIDDEVLQPFYYEQPSTNRVFKIYLSWIKFCFLKSRNASYIFDAYDQANVAVEVVQEEGWPTEWVEVNDNE